MTTTVPDEALEWVADKSIDGDDAVGEIIFDIAVGSGSAGVSSSQTQLDVQEFRGNTDDSTISIENTTPTIGELQCRITVNGGTEVPAGTEITEVGVFARDPTLPDSNFEDGNQFTNDGDDVMIYRELRPGLTLSAGDQKTFQFTINVTQS